MTSAEELFARSVKSRQKKGQNSRIRIEKSFGSETVTGIVFGEAVAAKFIPEDETATLHIFLFV